MFHRRSFHAPDTAQFVSQSAAAIRRAPRFALTAGLLATFVILAGCDLDAVDPPQYTVWEAEFPPLDTEDPEEQYIGTAGMVTGDGTTEAGVSLEMAPPGAELGWSVRTGTCDGSGEPIFTGGNAFPGFTISELGEGGQSNGGFGDIDPDRNYAAELLSEPGGGEVVNCTDLERTS